MNPRAIWAFIAGDSRLGPALAAAAIVVTLLLLRFAPVSTTVTGVIFFALVATALVASVFEGV
jgi:hypothetical protein